MSSRPGRGSAPPPGSRQAGSRTGARSARPAAARAASRAPAWQRGARGACSSSVELLQVHAGIELADLGFIAVEHQCRPALGEQAGEALAIADATLARLAPARMVDLRVHVRVEAVFAGVGT